MCKKVIIVEDNVDTAKILKDILIKTNLEVYVAFDGMEAIKKITEVKPDIVILDLFLPKQNGVEVLKILQQNENTKSIPVMIITGKDIDSTTFDSIISQSNVKGFYSKPIDPDIIVSDIKKTLVSEQS